MPKALVLVHRQVYYKYANFVPKLEDENKFTSILPQYNRTKLSNFSSAALSTEIKTIS